VTTDVIVLDSSSGIYSQISPPIATTVFKILDVIDDFVLTERLPMQDYFWTPEWQQGEMEADTDIKAGRLKSFSDAKNLIAYLKSLES
jgi:hypothetical protein